jgi:hypothetical protein
LAISARLEGFERGEYNQGKGIQHVDEDDRPKKGGREGKEEERAYLLLGLQASTNIL